MIPLMVCLIFAACLLLAMSQERHWKSLAGAAADHHRARVMSRFAAAALLGVALMAGIAVEGAGFAVLVWTLLANVASVAIAMVLAFLPALLRPQQPTDGTDRHRIRSQILL